MTAAHHHPDDDLTSTATAMADTGNSHAPKDFGRAFAIGIALNVGFVLTRVFGSIAPPIGQRDGLGRRNDQGREAAPGFAQRVAVNAPRVEHQRL